MFSRRSFLAGILGAPAVVAVTTGRLPSAKPERLILYPEEALIKTVERRFDWFTFFQDAAFAMRCVEIEYRQVLYLGFTRPNYVLYIDGHFLCDERRGVEVEFPEFSVSAIEIPPEPHNQYRRYVPGPMQVTPMYLTIPHHQAESVWLHVKLEPTLTMGSPVVEVRGLQEPHVYRYDVGFQAYVVAVCPELSSFASEGRTILG